MKTLITFVLVVFSLFTFGQNMIYFERQSPYTDFTSGNGSVAIQELGVSSSITILVKYKQLIGGTPISTGWINHTGSAYNDVYNDTIRAVGVYNGDTLIRSKHIFNASNYEVIDATATGFDSHGLYDPGSNAPYEIAITFDGPTTNSDAEITTIFGFGSAIYSVNNVLTINQNNSIFPPVMAPVLFNNTKSQMTINSGNINYLPNANTNNSLLNAYIPRITTRPNTINDCGGEISFERAQLVNDVNLEYSINGAPFTTLTSDNFSGLCAYDTISILGYSPTIMPGDTLVKTQYILRSADSLGQYDFDLSEVEIQLNLNNTTTNGCENTLTFTHYLGNSTDGLGLLLNEFEEVLTVDIDPNFNEYGSICQAQYLYSGVLFGNNPSPFISSNFSDFASLTIVDVNDSVSGLPVNSEVSQTFTDSLLCTSDVIMDRLTSPNYSLQASYTDYVSNNPGTYDENNTTNIGFYTDSISVNGLCHGIYTFNDYDRKRFVFVTDSLQQLDVTYNQLLGNGANGYMVLPDIDTLKLFYEECTNNYNLPFNTVDYYKTNSEVSTVQIPNSGFNIEEFSSSFDLTQGSNSFFLHERPVMMIDYTSYPNPAPYYIIAELFCQNPIKTSLKRRRIIIAPDGTVTQEYDGNVSLSAQENEEEVNIYPNPASQTLTIESSKGWESFEIISTNGRTVKHTNNLEELTETNVDVSQLESGVYLIHLNSNKGTVIKKLIIK
jgi:hypothetical protein